ncbi:MAG: PH domain-containing protein [Candidatus Kariarchaeaceae archaeon]|jgi:hypothetical protein
MALNKIIGNAVLTENEQTQKKLEDILTENERIELAFKVVRDRVVFTNKRLIFIDYQGATARKVDYISIPYRSIIYFSVETGGHIDLDFELKVWVTGRTDPFERTMKKNRGLAHQMIKLLTDYTT